MLGFLDFFQEQHFQKIYFSAENKSRSIVYYNPKPVVVEAINKTAIIIDLESCKID